MRRFEFLGPVVCVRIVVSFAGVCLSLHVVLKTLFSILYTIDQLCRLTLVDFGSFFACPDVPLKIWSVSGVRHASF